MNAAEVRAFLERHGLQPRVDLGQNFLIDESIAARLVDHAGVAAGDSVIEIGTGLGILTRALAARAARVVTLDVDRGLVRALREEAMLPANVRLVHADAREFDFAAAIGELAPPVRLVANLPYAASAPLLRRLLDLAASLADWSVMLQRELAARLLASPGTRDYGSFAVLHQLVVRVERRQELSPRCFHPVPRVRSSFVHMTPLETPLLAPGELPRLERVVRAAFATRRKTLANALRGSDLGASGEAIADALRTAEIDPRARAESLEPVRLLALARALPERGE